MRDQAYIEYLETVVISLLNERGDANEDVPCGDPASCNEEHSPFNSRFTFSPPAIRDCIRDQRNARDENYEKIDPKKIGKIREVVYETAHGEHKGEWISVSWCNINKRLFSNQICLTTPLGHILPIIRKGQL